MQQKQQTGCQYKYKFYSIYSNHVRISNIKDDLNAFFFEYRISGRKAIAYKAE